MTIYLVPTPNAGPDAISCNLKQMLAATGTWASGFWSLPNYFLIDDATAPNSLISAPSGGSYTITWHVVTEEGCTASDDVTVLFTDPMDGFSATTDAICNNSCDGTASVSMTGGNGAYFYIWLNGIAANVPDASGLCAGNYTVIVSDTNNCHVTVPISIGQPEPLVIDAVVTSAETSALEVAMAVWWRTTPTVCCTRHQASHLWAIHRVHHVDTRLDVSTTVRFHPLEFRGHDAADACGRGGARRAACCDLLIYELLDASVTVFSHANVRLPWWIDRPLSLFIVTPDVHRVHHSSHQPETDSNFGAVLTIWDRVLGTYRRKSADAWATQENGLCEVQDGRSRNILWLLILPFIALKARAVSFARGKE